MATMDKGTAYDIFDHSIEPSVQRSLFNMSYLHSFTAEMGELIPFYLQETIPNDKFTLSNDILIRVNPMIVPLMSRLRVYTHYYYSRNSELWSKWDNFITRGRSGNYEVTIPYLTYVKQDDQKQTRGYKDKTTEKIYGIATEDSIPVRMGLIPISQYYGNSKIENPSKENNLSQDKPIKIHAIPLMMYQRIYRDYYMNQNLNQNDKKWFPDDDTDFILKSGQNGIEESEKYYCIPTLNQEDLIEQGVYTPTAKGDYLLTAKRYRNWRDDYFTSALPWPQRGEPPVLTLSTEEIKLPVDDIMYEYGNDGNREQAQTWHESTNQGSFYIGGVNRPKEGGKLTTAGNKTIAGAITTPITMEKLRQLSIMQLWQERNARASYKGNIYNNMIEMHFGYNPREKDNTPQYIGGTVQDISVSELLQTSATTYDGDDVDSPQGNGTGHGTSASAGYVGEFNCPDYGWIMGIMSIVPDVTYSEGIDREYTRETFADYYYPEFNGLGAQAILGKEIYYTGEDEEDNKVWAYQERFSEMKHRRNRVSGKLANKNDTYYKAWTMNRFFDAKPTLSESFVSTNGTIRKDAFYLTDEPPFTVQVANIARAVRPIPYKSIPKGLI